MPSQFDDIFATGREVLWQQHAREAAWTKPNGTTTAVSAVVGADGLVPEDADGGVTLRRSRPVELLAAEVPDPNRGDTFAVDGETWTFDAVEWRRGGVVGVRVSRPEQAEISHRGYRARP